MSRFNILTDNGKTPIPVEITGALDKIKRTATGIEGICRECGDKHQLSDKDIMAVDGGLHFASVARSYPLVKEINDLYANADKCADYIDYRLQAVVLNAKINTLGVNFVASAGVSMTLPCSHIASIRFDEALTFLKEPSRTELMLKLGITQERSYRYIKWVYADDAPVPSTYGKKKAEEIVDSIQQLEREKQEITEKAIQFRVTLNDMKLAAGRFQIEVNSAVDAWEIKDKINLTAMQNAELDRIDKGLQRVANKVEVTRQNDSTPVIYEAKDATTA